jgi:hypothetical protein
MCRFYDNWRARISDRRRRLENLKSAPCTRSAAPLTLPLRQLGSCDGRSACTKHCSISRLAGQPGRDKHSLRAPLGRGPLRREPPKNDETKSGTYSGTFGPEIPDCSGFCSVFVLGSRSREGPKTV